MGEITIPLVYIYGPIIFFVSYYIIKAIVISIVKSYLKRKYEKFIKPKVYDIAYETFREIEHIRSNGLEVDERGLFLDNFIDFRKTLPNRLKIKIRLEEEYTTDLEDTCFDMAVGMNLIFPYWRTGVAYDPNDYIVLVKEEVMKWKRNNSISNILK